MSECPFCAIVAGEGGADIKQETAYALVLVPLQPVVEGHLLVVPKRHVADFSTSPVVSAMTMELAAQVAQGIDADLNLITSRGRAATQSVFHLHLHLVPRQVNDGLALPWYSGHSRAKAKMKQPDYDEATRAFLEHKKGLRK